MNTNTLVLTALAVALTSHNVSSDSIAVADNGRQVVLDDDGSWKYLSKDLFAITESGSRVRLKGDGRWQPAVNVEVIKTDQVVTSHVDVSLTSVTIESYRKKLRKGAINSHQTVFNMRLNLSESSENLSPRLHDASLFQVFDDSNKQYSVISITPSETLVKPGGSLLFSVRVEGAPTGLLAVGTQQLFLKVDAAVFATSSDLEFSSLVDDAQSIKRDEPF